MRSEVKSEFDIIIVGGGGSGLAAAVAAVKEGAQVLLLEKEPDLGGTTGIAVGSFTANRSRAQARHGIPDCWQDHATDAGQFAPESIEAKNNHSLRDYFLQETATTLAWLSEMGLRFSGPHPEPPNRVPRMHNVVPGAKAYIRTLEKQFRRRGGTILTQACVRKLLQEAGQITGVRYQQHGEWHECRARYGVVLAGGDYANSPDLIAEYKGPDFARVEGINPNATGDGHHLARSVGARLMNMEVTYGPEIRFIPPPPGFRLLNWLTQRHLPSAIAGPIARKMPNFLMQAIAKRLLVTWQHPENALLDDGAILVNQSGHRFCSEHESPIRELAIAEQDQKQAYLLLDEHLATRYSTWPHFISTAPQIAYAYVADYLNLRPDIAQEAASLDQFTKSANATLTHLKATVEDYNRRIELGLPDLHGRPTRRPLTGQRWILLGPAKAYFTTTEGGAAINHDCQVLRKDGSVIPGLYAIGQNGLGGQILWGHGLHIAWAITSGRLVGQRLGQQLRQGSADQRPA